MAKPIEAEGQILNLESRTQRNKLKLTSKLGYAFLLTGGISLTQSILWSSSIMAFIGLGLILWGALLLLVRSKNRASAILHATAISPLNAIDRLIGHFKLEGKGVYLPPKGLKGLKGGVVFISSESGTNIQAAEKATGEKALIDQRGMWLIPPGLGLVNLYETELGKEFVKADLDYVQNNLPKLLIERLELAEDFEMSAEDGTIQATIAESIYKNFCSERKGLSRLCNSVGCPFCSSIAIALARTLGKPIVIDKHEFSKERNTIRTYFKIIEA